MYLKKLDPAILAVLPKHCRVLSITHHGSTNWSTGYRVDIKSGTRNMKMSYFLKIIEDPSLVDTARAEFEGQKAIASVIPWNAILPIAWGHNQNDQTKAWFLTHFRFLAPLSNDDAGFFPASQIIPSIIYPAMRHLHTQSVSPTGKFGFHTTPHFGPVPMMVDWTDNWEVFWTRQFRQDLEWAQGRRGFDGELVRVSGEFVDKVVPRLLRPLQTGGRKIKPSLCHGDLWTGNVQMDVATGRPVIFDPCPFYGHHEMDLQCMRSERYGAGWGMFLALFKAEPGAVSEPVEEFDDRNALYAIRNDILTAAMYPERDYLVSTAKDEMRRLITKYPDGIDGFKGDLTPTKFIEAIRNWEKEWNLPVTGKILPQRVQLLRIEMD